MIIGQLIVAADSDVCEESKNRLSGPWATSKLFPGSESVPGILKLVRAARGSGASDTEIDALTDSSPDDVFSINKKDTLGALRSVFEKELRQEILLLFQSNPHRSPVANDFCCNGLKVADAAEKLFGELWKIHKRHTRGMGLREALRYAHARGRHTKDKIVAAVQEKS